MFVAWNMTWTHCEIYWDLDFQPSESSGGQPVALEGFGVWPPVLGWDLANARIFICSFGMVLYLGIFHLQFWDGAF